MNYKCIDHRQNHWSRCDYFRNWYGRKRKWIENLGYASLGLVRGILPTAGISSPQRETIQPTTLVPSCVLSPSAIKSVPLEGEASTQILVMLVTSSLPFRHQPICKTCAWHDRTLTLYSLLLNLTEINK